jgi:hypothetical protein
MRVPEGPAGRECCDNGLEGRKEAQQPEARIGCLAGVGSQRTASAGGRASRSGSIRAYGRLECVMIPQFLPQARILPHNLVCRPGAGR